MTLETIIAIAVVAAFACYLVYRWQEAVVEMADPPYQEPVVDAEPSKQDVQAAWPFPSGSKP